MRKLLIVFVILFVNVISAQKGTFIGVVTDKEMNNEPLPFANVFVKGTTVGVTTDFDGNYALNVAEGEWTIVFSFIGYETVEKVVQKLGASAPARLRDLTDVSAIEKDARTLASELLGV